MRQAELDRLN